MHLAILALTMRAVLTRKPFAIAITEELNPGAIDNRFSGPGARRFDICTSIVFCLRLSVEKSGTGQSRPAIDRMLATSPVVCQSSKANRIVWFPDRFGVIFGAVAKIFNKLW